MWKQQATHRCLWNCRRDRRRLSKNRLETALSRRIPAQRTTEDTVCRNLRLESLQKAVEELDDKERLLIDLRYGVVWTDTRKHVTFVCPDGRRCRDSSLHDETFLKENLEALLAYRQAVGFRPGTEEPVIGWLGEAASALIRLGKTLEQSADLPPLPAPPVWTESKQRRRKALKKLAMGQKLSGDQYCTPSM